MRAGNQGLGKVFDCLIESVSTKWLIENKFLAPYRCFGIRLADTSSLHIKHGEFDNKESESLMSSKLIYGETIKNYKAYCDGKQTIVYCSGVKNSQATAAEFNSAGITAKHLDGTTPMFERKQAIQDFRDGKIKVLCNVDLFGEGFDVPDCECVILLRPTASLTLHIQQSMRSMRYKPGKTAIIIDHVCNTHIHGLPDDEREWSLEGKSKIKKVVKKTVKDCPECFAVLPISEKICKHCGYNFGETDTEKETETVDIILEEIVSADILRGKPYDSYRDCGTFDELERFRKAKGYKFAWSVFKAAELNILPVKYYNLARRMGVMYA
jgi:superfamily II DNA or RNA helicase